MDVPLTATPTLLKVPSLMQGLFPSTNNSMIRGSGTLSWLSAKAGLIKCSKPTRATVSFQLKDFCDSGVTDFNTVLRVGFRLSFHAIPNANPDELIANYVSPVIEETVTEGGPELNMEEAFEASDMPPGKGGKDTYSLAMEIRALTFLFQIFQKGTGAVHYITLSNLHSRISNSCEPELVRYIGSSSMKRRQFIEDRLYIFNLGHLGENDVIYLQAPEVYQTVTQLAQFLLKHGGVTSSDMLFRFFQTAPSLPLAIRDSIQNRRHQFMQFLARHPFVFAPFPAQFYVGVRRNLPYFDYGTFIRKSFPNFQSCTTATRSLSRPPVLQSNDSFDQPPLVSPLVESLPSLNTGGAGMPTAGSAHPMGMANGTRFGAPSMVNGGGQQQLHHHQHHGSSGGGSSAGGGGGSSATTAVAVAAAHLHHAQQQQQLSAAVHAGNNHHHHLSTNHQQQQHHHLQLHHHHGSAGTLSSMTGAIAAAGGGAASAVVPPSAIVGSGLGGAAAGGHHLMPAQSMPFIASAQQSSQQLVQQQHNNNTNSHHLHHQQQQHVLNTAAAHGGGIGSGGPSLLSSSGIAAAGCRNGGVGTAAAPLSAAQQQKPRFTLFDIKLDDHHHNHHHHLPSSIHQNGIGIGGAAPAVSLLRSATSTAVTASAVVSVPPSGGGANAGGGTALAAALLGNACGGPVVTTTTNNINRGGAAGVVMTPTNSIGGTSATSGGNNIWTYGPHWDIELLKLSDLSSPFGIGGSTGAVALDSAVSPPLLLNGNRKREFVECAVQTDESSFGTAAVTASGQSNLCANCAQSI